jgi:type IX secretion system PorP/SprF family membrane protein
MKFIYTLVIILILYVEKAKTQNFVTQEHCFVSDFIYNPAVAGVEENIVANISVKKNWIGIKDSPSTSLLNLYSNVANLGFVKNKKHISDKSLNVGLGLGLYSDKNGPLNTNGIQIAYSYQILLTKSLRLSMGLSAKLTQYSLNQGVFKPTDKDDPLLSNNTENLLRPNFNFGFWLYNTEYYLGLSTTNLADFNEFGNGLNYKETIRALFLKSGYKFSLNSNSILEPSLLLRSNKNKSFVDVNLKYTYIKHFWTAFGWGWGSPNAFSICLGFNVKDIYFGYIYEYSSSPLYSYSKGNHSLFLGFNL